MPDTMSFFGRGWYGYLSGVLIVSLQQVFWCLADCG
jgi:hypothetical protein